ncbi:MAG: VPA1269 family protein [Clostridiaceae bacterium]|nr:VPA1269 family protein [Clostridiaceae bacterium]
MSKSYTNEFKYKMIKLFCDGMRAVEIQRKYGVGTTAVMRWLRSFVDSGLFDENEVSPKERTELEQLREKANIELLLRGKNGETEDITIQWVLKLDEEFEEWRALAEEWLKTQVRNKSTAILAISKFFKEYLYGANVTKSPKEFLNTGYAAPDFYEISYAHFVDTKEAKKEAKKTIEFIDWILLEKYSVEDDFENRQVPHEFSNPIAKFLPESYGIVKRSESDKNVLPYRYIKELRSLLCPPLAVSFKDWDFAQKATDPKRSGGDWFIVDQTLIDVDDPDCVWRKRKSSKYEKEIKGVVDEIYEMWSPVVSVALLTKLLLPLRTYQVRMLDSGEMDTFKYIQPLRTAPGYWIKNDGPLAKGTEDNPFRKGAIRKFYDPVSKMDMTGFFINTNKTADINKEEDQKGYDIPWQYEEVLYWLAKLRNWQQKYNPVSGPTPWTDLKLKQLGIIKDKKILRQMGSTVFLFRNPSSVGDENLPVRSTGLQPLWFKLLSQLEQNVKSSASSTEEKSIKFIKNEWATFYPLHSLRVSLITAYALEGGVPMPILSKAIAGHARLVMTLYYTKAGISYVSDMMTQAESKILENEQESFGRFLRDAKLKELENSVAINDIAAYQAVVNAQASGAGIVIGDKGICPKGNGGCDSGGVFVNDGVISYGPVPGFPEQNCVRCRWFVTGPAFLPGLVHHFNTIGYNISETGKRVMQFQNKIDELENIKYECEIKREIFTASSDLFKAESLHQQEILKNDKLANDYNATLRLIDKCKAISKNKGQNGNLQLVPIGAMDDVELAINVAKNELELLQILCNGAEIYPETDVSKAILQRSQIIDLTMDRNGKKPVMFALTPEEQLIAGNQFMRLLVLRAGSLKDAVPYATGRKRLEEIGFVNEFNEEIKSMTLNRSILALEQDDIVVASAPPLIGDGSQYVYDTENIVAIDKQTKGG